MSRVSYPSVLDFFTLNFRAIHSTNYKPPFLFRNNHLHTITPSLFRKVKLEKCVRERVETFDKDFIDFDYYSAQNNVAVIINHGLEGNSKKAYVLGIAKALLEEGYDAIAVNLRGCGGEHNWLPSSYHSGKTDDLDLIVHHISEKFGYKHLILLGFSLGGNITLKYVGESGNALPSVVKAAVGISVPCDLKASSWRLGKLSNRFYLLRFLNSLKSKAIYKIETFKHDYIRKKDILKTKNFYQFDNLFTAPIHGFLNAEDYWHKSSCKQFLQNISIPALLINALDDPFLPQECYPYAEAEKNPFLHFETPKYGGHIGFISDINFKEKFWHETRIIEFIQGLNIR